LRRIKFQIAIIILLFILLPLTTKAQSVTYFGRIVDSETESPIPFAHLSLVGTNIGTVSNEEGYFSIKSSLRDSVPLSVSSIGYNTSTTVLNNNQIDQGLKIRLEPNAIELNEILISAEPESAKEILTQAYLRIPQNYFLKEHMITGYHKESENTNNEPIYIIEEIIEAQVPEKSSEDKIKIYQLKSRKKELQNVKKFKIDYKRGGAYGRVNSSIRTPRRSMRPDEMKRYTYSIDGYSVYNDRPVVIISITDSKKRKPYSGKFTIDLESYAYIRIERNKVHGDSMPTDDWKWTNHSRVEHFVQEDNGMWRLNSSSYVGKWIKKKTKQEFQYKEIYVTTGFSEEVNLSSTGTEFNYHDELYENVSSDFDPSFWGKYNYIKLNEAEENALKSINKQ